MLIHLKPIQKDHFAQADGFDSQPAVLAQGLIFILDELYINFDISDAMSKDKKKYTGYLPNHIVFQETARRTSSKPLTNSEASLPPSTAGLSIHVGMRSTCSGS